MSRLIAASAAIFLLAGGAAVAATRTDGSTPAPRNIAHALTHVPPRTLNLVGKGSVLPQSAFTVSPVVGGPLTSGGKPVVLTMNLAWCPHCAANSWALAVALSRFGTLSGLRIIDTGTLFGQFNHTHGLSFLTAHLKSPYVAFAPVVLQDVKGHNLENPSTNEQNAIKSFDAQGVFPAVDVGGGWGFVNSGYSPGVLSGRSWSQIANDLANPRSGVARSIDGLANLFTAAICTVTHYRPVGVCTSGGVYAAAGRLR